MSSNRTTRVMLAAANLDYKKIYDIFELRKSHPYKANTVEYGLNIKKIQTEVNQARSRLITRDIFIFFFSIIGIIFIFQAWDQLVIYFSNDYPNSDFSEQGFGYILFPFLAISFVDFLYQIKTKARARNVLYADDQELDQVTPDIDETNNIVISGGYSPFVGSGFEVTGWSFTVNTKRAGDESKEVDEIRTMDLYSETVTSIKNLKIENIIIKDEIFIDGRDVRDVAKEIPEILPSGEFSKPNLQIPDLVVQNMIENNSNKARHYKVLRVFLWDSQIVLTIFIRFVRKADTLFVETRIFMIPPLRQEYLTHESLPQNPPVALFLAEAISSCVKSLFIWIPILWKGFESFQEIFSNKQKANIKTNKKEIRDNKFYNYGIPTSLREDWSLGSNYERYFQMIDKDFYVKMIKETLLSSLLESLEKRNISIDDFKQASTRIFNEGIIVTGGNVNAESIAAGTGASSRVKIKK